MGAFSRLANSPVWSFRPDGSVLDLAAPDPCEISFHRMAEGLSKIMRFNASNRGPGWSVALHSVRGADAILTEANDPLLAAFFLLHDGEEHLLGDHTSPSARLHAAHAAWGTGELASRIVTEAWNTVKDAWRDACWQAARLPVPTNTQLLQLKNFDRRMCDAEMLALYGEKARAHLLEPDAPTLRIKGGIKPLPPMKAEEQFIASFDRLIGAERRVEQEAIHAAHVALNTGGAT